MTRKMPTIPISMIGRVWAREAKFITKPLSSYKAGTPLCAHQGQQQAAGDDRGDLTRNVNADGVHQQEVLVVLRQAHLVDHTAAHGEGRDAGRADHGVDLLALGQEEVEQLGEQDAARGIEHEGEQAQSQNQEGVGADEFVGRHLAGDGHAQQDGDQVGQGVLGGLAQGVQHAALTQQVAEHQEADQRHAGGGDQAGHHRDHDGEQDAGGAGDAALLVGHADAPLLFGGDGADDRRLDDGHQGHIAVGGHHDGAQVLGAQGVGHEDGGGAVGRADDADGNGVVQIKEDARQADGEENAELGGCAEQHQPGLFQQGAEVDHGADADEQQQGEQLVRHTCLEQHRKGAFGVALGDGARQGQVDEDGAEAHRQQQAGLHLFGNGQVDQQAAYDPHDQHLPGQVPEVREQTCKLSDDIHGL